MCRGVAVRPRQNTQVKDRVKDGLFPHRLRACAWLRQCYATAVPAGAQRHLERPVGALCEKLKRNNSAQDELSLARRSKAARRHLQDRPAQHGVLGDEAGCCWRLGDAILAGRHFRRQGLCS